LLASTWLLASFTGIGFVITKLNGDPSEALILCLISAGGSVGILIIWALDILGYHRLLAANFIEGLRIEIENQHLPQTRWLMMEFGTVGSKARTFYFICALSPVLAGMILLFPSFKICKI